jgi:diaminopimelate decarboxylase
MRTSETVDRLGAPSPELRRPLLPRPPGRLTASDMSTTLSEALDGGYLLDLGETVVFYDLSRLTDTLQRLKQAFPVTALHAIATKANPVLEILKHINLEGHGAEVASRGELALASAAGFPSKRIVFDSPAKTIEELGLALSMGINVNANSLHELKRLESLFRSTGSKTSVGIRVNPEIGTGAIESTSVAAKHSKFGVSLSLNRSALLQAFAEYPWLNGVHVHIGSQGMSKEQLLAGVSAVFELFNDARQRAAPWVFNIGGGLPAQYRHAEAPMQFEEYSSALCDRIPELFGADISIVTEFGRSVHASCGWVATKVEYVSDSSDDIPTVFVHVGADMFLRKAYRPDDWHHDITVCDQSGRLRTGEGRIHQLAGPLCFAGDFIDRHVRLPADIQEGDYVLIHDSGAYTFGMWSMYNSRLFPPIIAYGERDGVFRCIRRRQTPEDIVTFWAAPP